MFLKTKSYQFAVNIVSLNRVLVTENREYVISKQLLRSGTAVGALVREAEFAQSPKDFIHKLSISLKEANESLYWIDLLKDTGYLTAEQYASIRDESLQLIKLLVSSIKTTKSKL